MVRHRLTNLSRIPVSRQIPQRVHRIRKHPRGGFDRHCLLNLFRPRDIGQTLSVESSLLRFLIRTGAATSAFLQTVSERIGEAIHSRLVSLRRPPLHRRRPRPVTSTKSRPPTTDWSVRELRRQIDSSLYQRLALSRDKQEVRRLARDGQMVETPSDLIKNPYVLEFLGLAEQPAYSESDMEAAIINRLEQFLLELGKGFLFEARQKRFSFDDKPLLRRPWWNLQLPDDAATCSSTSKLRQAFPLGPRADADVRELLRPPMLKIEEELSALSAAYEASDR